MMSDEGLRLLTGISCTAGLTQFTAAEDGVVKSGASVGRIAAANASPPNKDIYKYKDLIHIHRMHLLAKLLRSYCNYFITGQVSFSCNLIWNIHPTREGDSRVDI